MKKSSTLVTLLLAAATWNSQAQELFSNGPIATGAVSKSGVAAPAGAQWSETQNDTGNPAISNREYGFGFTTPTGIDVADDFEVPAGQRWTVTSFSFYGCLNGGPSETSPYSELYIRVWRGQPGTPGATLVFGDKVINRLAKSTGTQIYRILNSLYPTGAPAPDLTRKVWELSANTLTNLVLAPNLVLGPGKYWVSWQAQLSYLGGHYMVPVTIEGSRTRAGANAQGRENPGTDDWTTLLDTGSSRTNPVNVEMAFKVNGTSTSTLLATRAGQASSDGLSIQASPMPATDAVHITLDQLKGSAQLLLTDLNGRLAWKGVLPAGSTTATVPLTQMAQGLYLLEARTATGSVRARIVKE